MNWIKRWNTWISDKPETTGIWKRKEGGRFVRLKVTNPKTGKRTEIMKVLADATLAEAAQWLAEERAIVRSGEKRQTAQRPRFGGYAVSLFERKVARGEIRSAATKEKWASLLKTHLIPYFGDHYLDSIRRSDVERWKDHVATMIAAGRYKPATANDWLAMLKVILTTAVGELELERNPMLGVKSFDTSTHRTYTKEQPNSLIPAEVVMFLEQMLEDYPQHYAMVVLGLTTGLRPSSMRPLRWRGPESDIDWDTGTILVRRSHTRGQAVMARTKTGKDVVIHAPKSLLDVLRWHVANLSVGAQSESDLLFPTELGTLRSASVLVKPIDTVIRKLEIAKRITPRALRRTFNDLARAAEVKDVVTRSISGHLTEAMQHRYSTATAEEQRTAIAGVIELAGFRRKPQLGGHLGGHGGGQEKAG